MALGAMEHGKHAFVEVAAAVTVWPTAGAWSTRANARAAPLHDAGELLLRGGRAHGARHGPSQGVFGELTHGECAYIHDLRSLLFDLGGEGGWRRNYHLKYNGNLYPTHGLGPVAQYLGLGRGDQFRFLVSVSSPEKGLTGWRDQHQPNGGKHAAERYVCGDMNTSLLKTELGRTIMIQHDVISPRPYSRINHLSGTGATFSDYPARLAVNEPKAYGLAATGSHEWLGTEDLAKMRERFTHPLWRRLSERAKGSGHGGMDFVMNWRHLDCIRKGVTPDSVVYDAAAWSCIIEISAQRRHRQHAGGHPRLQPRAVAGPRAPRHRDLNRPAGPARRHLALARPPHLILYPSIPGGRLHDGPRSPARACAFRPCGCA